MGRAVTSKYAGEKLIETMFNDELFDKLNHLVYCDLGEIIQSSPASYNESREEKFWKFLNHIKP